MELLIIYLLAGSFLVLKGAGPKVALWLSSMWVFRVAVFLHGVILLLEWVEMGSFTRGHIFQSMGLSLGLLYLLCLKAKDSQGLMWIFLPLLLILSLGAAVAPEDGILREELLPYGKSIFTHIFLALLGYASFFLVTLCSILYLLQSKLLKVSNNNPWLSKVPSLLELTTIKWRALSFGLVFFTFAIGLGKLSPYLWGVPHHWGAKEILSVMTWTLYLVLFLGRKYFKQHKEAFAYTSLVGCALLLLTLVAINAGIVSWEGSGL